MMFEEKFETLDLLPVVKAYPNLSRSYGETSCIACLTLPNDGASRWIRLYPVPFRQLEADQQFHKYQPIRVRVQAARGDDRRPESRRVDADSIETLGSTVGTEKAWAARRPLVEPMIGGSMCGLLEAERRDRTSLGIFRPAEVLDLVIEEVEPDPTKSDMAEAFAAQQTLLGVEEKAEERKALELIPCRFLYRYRCSAPGCRTHTQSIVDWEIAQFFRSQAHHADWKERLRDKWLGELCDPARDTAFVVGNQNQHRQSFLVLGVWWPPAQPEQLSLSTGET